VSSLGSQIGWIGTGRMGHAMAGRLLAAGQNVHIWNRTRAKALDLADSGVWSSTGSPT
jgi:3-hydroxyisobutyrate dehydrogenase